MSRRKLARVGLFAACFLAATVSWGCGSDSENSDEGEEPTLEECLESCEDACPAPDQRVCASDGERYCNTCVLSCHDLEVADDASTCDAPSCPDGLDQVDSESDCLQDDAICMEVDDGVWCTGPDDMQPPELVVPGALDTDQDTPLSFTVDGHAGSAGGDLTVEVVSGPSNGTIAPTEGTAPLELTYTPEAGFSGEDTIEVVGTTDGGSSTDAAPLSITVHSVNTAPTISSISDQSIEPSGTTGPLDFTVSDAETPADDLDVSAVSLDTDVIPDDQITLGGSGEDRTIEVEAGQEVGTATVELTVSDGELSSSTEFEVTLTGVCPLMTYECASGCCATDSHVISERRGSYPYLDVGPEGNVYITFALPSSTAWSTGLTVYTAETGEFDFFSYTNHGDRRPGIEVAPSGRIHHHYAHDRGTAFYQYSDDQGQSWTPIDGIPGNLSIVGTCSMAIESDDDPHLLCGMEESVGNRGVPRYIEWDGAQWNSELADLEATMNSSTIMELGFDDRAHVVHTYGPSEGAVHYSYNTGTQWITEEVPVPDGYRDVSRDRRVGFVLADNDVVHVAFAKRKTDSVEYQVWYGVRTIDPNSTDGDWSFEVAIPFGEMAEETGPDISMDLDENGDPVIFTNVGTGAYRDATGDWHVLQTGWEVNDVAVHDGEAYIAFPVDGATYQAQRLHLSVIDLTP
jgi:hypothetical protein